ncbi:MAG: YitT family protein [Desulfovibrio sp.]
MIYKMGPSELARRYLFLLVGLFILSIGVAFSIKCNLGTSPISSPPYVISLFSPLTVGNITIIMHCIFVAMQIAIYRKNFRLQQLLQIPIGFIFGYLIDFSLWITSPITADNYFARCILCIIGILLVGIGVGVEVLSRVAILAGDGLVLAIYHGVLKDKLYFRRVKIFFDTSLVLIACIISLIFLHKLAGVREGTVAAALFVGAVARPTIKLLMPLERKYLSCSHSD